MCVREGAKRIALVAPTYADAREVMIAGESGLLNIGYPAARPVYESSRRRLVWPGGAVGHVFSAEDPEGLRGPEFHCAWADEFCAWAYPEDTLSNLRFGLRLGQNPRLLITTTPKPIPALRDLLAQKGVVTSRARTFDNKAFLSKSFLGAVEAVYGGTRLGRQEMDGEILQDHAGALFTLDMFDRLRAKHLPGFERIIVAVDPPASSGPNADACGLIVAARAGPEAEGGCVCYILHDGTVQGLTPMGWGGEVLKLWEGWDADYILAEVNQGGEMVKTILSSINADAVVKTVYASRSKSARAEPVAALYEQGKVRHVGTFKALEDEMCRLGSTERSSKSPDRADALVWAVTDLMLKPRAVPKIRAL